MPKRGGRKITNLRHSYANVIFDYRFESASVPKLHGVKTLERLKLEILVAKKRNKAFHTRLGV
jgi:hypothetical protein